MIPKIIHYCWLSGDEVPENLRECMSTWKEKLPDYEFILWDFSRFEKESSIWVSEAFENKKYAFAADYIRLYAVYHCGGIYLDMDVEVVKSFNDLLNLPCMLAYEQPNKIGFEAGCFGAEKGNAYIKACLDYYEGRHFVKADGSFDTKTLPLIMQEAFEANEFDYPLFDHNYFTAKSGETGIVTVTKDTYAVHHFAGSWLSPEEKYQNEVKRKLIKVLPDTPAGYCARFVTITKFHGIRTAFQETIDWLNRVREK